VERSKCKYIESQNDLAVEENNYSMRFKNVRCNKKLWIRIVKIARNLAKVHKALFRLASLKKPP